MKNALALAAALLLACSGSSSGTDAGTDASTNDASSNDTATKDAGPSDAASDAGTCAPPKDGLDASCPTSAGNCKHIGDPCTKGGKQCPAPTACDIDLDPTGVGICITYFACAPNKGQCGAGATCCQTAMTQNTPVCLPNQCLPSDCTPEQ